jgi:hypothetical protein
MKTILTTTAFILTFALTGLAHAGGFNDRTAIPETALTPTPNQDLSHIPEDQGFQQQSVHAQAASDAPVDREPAVIGAHCELEPRFGFQQQSVRLSC